MKLTEIVEMYGDCEVDESSIKRLLFRENKWYPVYGEKYWYIDCMKDVEYSEWDGAATDFFLLATNNIYKSMEEAVKAIEVFDFCYAKSITPNWKIRNLRYYLGLDYSARKAKILMSNSVGEFAPFYYDKEEDVQEIIDKFSFDELEKYYGRV